MRNPLAKRIEQGASTQLSMHIQKTHIEPDDGSLVGSRFFRRGESFGTGCALLRMWLESSSQDFVSKATAPFSMILTVRP